MVSFTNSQRRVSFTNSQLNILSKALAAFPNIETMDREEKERLREINPVPLTIINPKKETKGAGNPICHVVLSNPVRYGLSFTGSVLPNMVFRVHRICKHWSAILQKVAC